MPQRTTRKSPTRQLLTALACVGLGAGLSLGLASLDPAVALLHAGGISSDFAAKLREDRAGPPLPFFYQLPNVPLGDGVYRRRGPMNVHENVLANYAIFSGRRDHPYADLPPVRVSYGPLGFRNELPAVEGGVAFVGNSYLEAGFVEAPDTIPGQLRRRHGVATANFGLAVADGRHVEAYLEHFVLPSRPSWVVWVLAERFDMLPSETRRRRLGSRALPPPTPASAPRRMLGFAGSFLDSVARSLLIRAADLDQGRSGNAILIPVERNVDGVQSGRAVLVPVAHCLYRAGDASITVDCLPPPPRGLAAMAFRELSPQLARAAALCEAGGARLLLAMIPSRARVLDGLLELFGEDPGVDPLRYELSNGYRHLAQMARREGIPFVDLLPELRAAALRGVLTVNPVVDLHLNSEGMRIASERIGRALSRHDPGLSAAR